MESELLNAVNYIKNISNKNVIFAKIEAFMRNKELFTCKEDLDTIIDNFIENDLIQVRGDGENAAFQIANKINSSQISPSPESINDCTENTEENQIRQNKKKYCATMETFKYDPSVMNEKLDWIYAEIEKIKELQAIVESKFTKLELTNTTPVQLVELKTEFLNYRKRFRKKTRQFLNRQLSVKNAFTIPLQNQSQERRSANNNPLNDSIESKVPRGDAHTIKLNKKRKVVVTGDSLLNGISKKGLLRDHQVTVNNFLGGTSEKGLEEIENLVADKADCIIIHAGRNDITNGINSLNSVKNIVKDVKKSSPNTKLVFSSILLRKDKKVISTKMTDINSRLKNYCQQKHLDFIDDSNMLEEHLGKRKLHLNKRGNSV